MAESVENVTPPFPEAVVDPFPWLTKGRAIALENKRLSKANNPKVIEKDTWYSLEPAEQDRRILALGSRITTASENPHVTSSQKDSTYQLFKDLGLARTFQQMRDSLQRDWKRRNPKGGKTPMGEIYTKILRDFTSGRFGGAEASKALLLSKGPDRLRSNSTLDAVRARKEKSEYSLVEVVAWVADHLLDDVEAIAPDEIPNAEALSMLCWAKANEGDFRSMYDSKRMPNRAQIERGIGMTDSGSNAQAVIEELLKVGD